MLVSPKLMLEKARKNNYAIAHANICDLHTLRAIIKACEEAQKPVIIGVAEVHFKYISLEEAANFVKFYAARTDLPVALHLDHGLSVDTAEKAIKLGYTSVMIDGSKYSFDENVKLTSSVVEMAHKYGVPVEAEIGHVGVGSDYESKSQELKDLYTDPKEAVEFVRKTGLDSLAVAIGTAHGDYKGVPEIDYDRLVEIRKAVDVPLVLHGSSGTGLDKIRKCVELGINKVNIFTDLTNAANKYLQGTVNQLRYEDSTLKMEDEISACLKTYFEILNSRL
ncbi:MAG: class II fructose-bisphosphate aldolase [Bacillota bacterium]